MGVVLVVVWLIWAAIGFRKSVDATTSAIDLEGLLSSAFAILLAVVFAIWVLWCLHGKEQVVVRDGDWTVCREFLGWRKPSVRELLRSESLNICRTAGVGRASHFDGEIRNESFSVGQLRFGVILSNLRR